MNEKEWGNTATPNILELQNAIAEAARICGKPRGRFIHKLPNDHPAHMALEEALSLRSIEHNNIARFILDRTVYRLRRKIRAPTGIAQAEFFLINPRAPRRKKTGQQQLRGLNTGEPGAETSFDPDQKSFLLTHKAKTNQTELPRWVRLDGHIEKRDLDGMPRIDGAHPAKGN